MRVGITTGGGDCPGLNAVIRAAVHTGIHHYGWEMLGVEDGLRGLLRPDGVQPLTTARVRDILARGGTILGTTNRGNPFRTPVIVDGQTIERDDSDLYLERIRMLGMDALIFVGGDGTQDIAWRFFHKGLPVVGVPKTIDNDLDATDYTFGFDSAVQVATDALDRLHTTAESHDRVMIVEMMGRNAGWITMHAGLAGGAHVILLPEIPYDLDAVLAAIALRARSGLTYTVVAISEGAKPKGGEVSLAEAARAGTNARLGGAGERLAQQILSRHPDMDVRVTVLGHLQRGGSPSSFDRLLGTRMGVRAAELVAERRFGRMVCLRGTAIEDVSIEHAIGRMKAIDPDGELVRVARRVGVSLGDGS